MKKLITVTFIVLAEVVIACAAISPASAQFSKAVVMLKGSIHSQQTGKACSVRISILSEDKSSEINTVRSNSESGNYLIILKTNTKYWMRIQGEGFTTMEELIETPASQSTFQMNRNINMTESSDPNAIGEKAIMK